MNELKFGMLAGEAREYNLTVPEHVPDCAMLMPLDVDESTICTRDGEHGQVIIEMQIKGYWKWVEVKLEIDA